MHETSIVTVRMASGNYKERKMCGGQQGEGRRVEKKFGHERVCQGGRKKWDGTCRQRTITDNVAGSRKTRVEGGRSESSEK